jgi:hypothetical protein
MNWRAAKAFPVSPKKPAAQTDRRRIYLRLI